MSLFTEIKRKNYSHRTKKQDMSKVMFTPANYSFVNSLPAAERWPIVKITKIAAKILPEYTEIGICGRENHLEKLALILL